MEIRVGMRLRCENCGSEAIVTKPGEPHLECCGSPLMVTFQPAGAEASSEPGTEHP